MRSNTVSIDNHGKGFEDVALESRKVAAYVEMKPDDQKRMQLLLEEMMSVVQTASGDMEATFWIECENGTYDLHLNTRIVLDREQRDRLISGTTSGKNAAVRTFRDRLRDRLERARASETDHDYDELPLDVLNDMPAGPVKDPERDSYERSIVRNVADTVKIGILRGVVDVVVSKKYA